MMESFHEKKPRRKWSTRAILAALGLTAMSLLPSDEKSSSAEEGDLHNPNIEHTEDSSDIESHIQYIETSIESIETNPAKPGLTTLEFKILNTFTTIDLPTKNAGEIISSNSAEIAYITNEEGQIIIIGVTPPGMAQQFVRNTLSKLNPPGYFSNTESTIPPSNNPPGHSKQIDGTGDNSSPVPDNNPPGYFEVK